MFRAQSNLQRAWSILTCNEGFVSPVDASHQVKQNGRSRFFFCSTNPRGIVAKILATHQNNVLFSQYVGELLALSICDTSTGQSSPTFITGCTECQIQRRRSGLLCFFFSSSNLSHQRECDQRTPHTPHTKHDSARTHETFLPPCTGTLLMIVDY